MYRSLLLVIFILVPGTGQAQNAPLWLRYPAISPDGNKVAFSYQGQIWVVPSEGGEAVPLTATTAYAFAPVWSPDGSRIAFASTKHGNSDVFVMPAEGGEATRLTYHSDTDTPMAFSPDGAEVYFSSTRIGDPVASGDDSIRSLLPKIAVPHSVPVGGGRVHRLWPTAAIEISPNADGKQFLYADDPAPFEDPRRKHQTSSAAQNVWLFDNETGRHTKLTEWREEDHDPSWMPDGSMVWLSEHSGSFNVWHRDVAGGEAVQLTHHETWPVRFLSAADNGTLAYTYDGGLWRLLPGGEPERIDVRIRQASLVGGRSVVNVKDQVSEMAVSPDGSEIALIARGEVFVASASSGATRRITDTPAAERFVTWGPDGRRLAYASERDGTWDVVEAQLTRDEDTGFAGAAPFKEHVLIGTGDDDFQPAYSPDGTHLAYIRHRTELRVLDIATGTSAVVLPADASYSYYDGDHPYAWGPDGKWLAVMLGYGSSAEIGLVDAEGKAGPVNISQNGFSDFDPMVSADGNIVLWTTDRFGLRSETRRIEAGDIFAAFLTPEAFADFNGLTDGAVAQSEDQDAAAVDATEAGTASPYPDLSGLEYRSTRLTPFSAKIAYAHLGADNRSLTFVVDQPNGTSVGYALTAGSGSASTIFTRPTLPGTIYAMSGISDFVYVYAAGSITKYDVASGTPSPLAFKAEMTRDSRAEIAALFEHIHRMTGETFYDANMQGHDWEAIGAHYRKFLPQIIWWEDVVELVAEAVGELNASHQSVIFFENNPNSDNTGSLALYYDDDWRGAGMKISEVIPGGPADHPGSALKAGAVIVSVDGAEITPEIDIHRLLNRKAGQEVLLGVQPMEGDIPVFETIFPITQIEENHFAYLQWVSQRRAIVERLSGGRLGYIHLKMMNLSSYQAAFGDTFGRYAEAEGLIVDVRANGGGNLHDQLIAMLTGNHTSDAVSREGNIVYTNPKGRWTKPSAVLGNAQSYSDGSVFPTLYQAEGIGPIIGAPIPGTGTAVVQPPLIDPRFHYGIPEMGFRLLDGRFLENLEVEPDVLVYNDPESIAAGRDLQLEAAVDTLLSVIGEGGN
ncbi:S41 family peptidase [Sinisalibacter aestuarii]|nr:S41 family peptidase [Sinisalibacter aestuarii]